jgi:hypothetical protein
MDSFVNATMLCGLALYSTLYSTAVRTVDNNTILLPSARSLSLFIYIKNLPKDATTDTKSVPAKGRQEMPKINKTNK